MSEPLKDEFVKDESVTLNENKQIATANHDGVLLQVKRPSKPK